ncbi:DUF2599 domain-containing protein [Streptomyces sp. V1I1]|uniref:DUF2599 domain-containing protein n=1 Tax=Streptomyces sp. V1I1 TaxID=3042272 RepID=UPI0027D8D945|nr:DUF2599 domain-containing protein [Streptomyces sp. V1I1]
MATPRRSARTKPTLARAAAIALAAVAALTVQTPPAAADDICGHQVGGDILKKYRDIGGENSPLGCPTSDELTTPNGRGKYNTFTGGSIYWTPEHGAHPVWGAIRDKWAGIGWEAGKLGFPVGDELTNTDGQGKRQQFEGGTVYWHPTLSHGAHPVWGRIGELWGEHGWEGGEFGYPTSDETPVDRINGVTQSFSGRQATLYWSASMGPKQGVCEGECVGYQAHTNAEWISKTRVARGIDNGNVDVEIFPTDAGFEDADRDYDRLWDQAWSAVPYPKKLTDAQGSSMYKQLACHARYSYPLPGGGHNGGDTWQLESWRPDVSWDYAMNPIPVGLHGCNWT